VSPCCDFFSFFVIAYRFYNTLASVPRFAVSLSRRVIISLGLNPSRTMVASAPSFVEQLLARGGYHELNVLPLPKFHKKVNRLKLNVPSLPKLYLYQNRLWQEFRVMLRCLLCFGSLSVVLLFRARFVHIQCNRRKNWTIPNISNI
jgi:hypothetical protein